MIREKTSYSFSDFFNLGIETEDVAAYFGYTFQVQNITLPKTSHPLDRLDDLKSRIEESQPFISFVNETARREFLIAPVLTELIHYTQAKIKVEYPIAVSEQLKGTLDYYIQSHNNLLVIEAKKEDLVRGFTQLSVELIALDQWGKTEAPLLFGAVSMGHIWQFGFLNRPTKTITQDLNLFRVPADLEDLMKILVGILER
jgi:hypothetical protein